MRTLSLLILLILFNSCAKIGYLYEQGIGQFRLLYDARENEKVLADSSIPEKTKEKIKEVIKYKKFFYEYWYLDSTDIYSRTNILDRDAVTYLVIASKKNELKAKKNCFPIVGCFPYLGFFKKDSAKEHVKKLQAKDFDTYMRKVPAYSTLGKFDDPILSTFLKYQEFDLAETVFHELFHTIFFIDDEVDLNENLANYFGKMMLYEYFKDRKEDLDKHFAALEKGKVLREEIVRSAKELRTILKADDWKNRKEEFTMSVFPKRIQALCDNHRFKNCWPLRLTWNNATFVAFMTYEKSQNRIEELAKKHGYNLRQFFTYIQSKYQDFKKSDAESFEKYLLN